TFIVKDKKTDSTWTVHPEDHLMKYQAGNVATRPDFIWQFARYISKQYRQQGYEVAVYAKACCSVNGRQQKPLTDSTIDLAATPWLHFKHNRWVLTDYK